MKDQFSRTRIRFDGFTRPGDVRLASELGVDAIGFEFAQGARRQIRVEDARFMRHALAPLVSGVAILRDNSVDEVREVVRQLRPALLEFRGDEDDVRMRSFGVPYARALRREEWAMMNAGSLQTRYPNASMFVLYADETEEPPALEAEWSWLPEGLARPLMLAGGIAPGNVSAIIGTLGPWGVSALEGIEVAPGRVDGDRMNSFLRESRDADCRKGR
ncbi:N-(5'-phosphoribosyl)anthranilate isomerase [Solilutibacter silvestris]|uniref:phosphoribosylanthranilate isomerase n=1 Tax=Solilutibacter silvestris TaxID=1645665 RepID=UPI000CA07AEF|nr:N-(5'-phosphoribosyl)anthranilate isomerase [Lysobacter silvestris]